MNRAEKKERVEEFKKDLGDSDAIFISDYRGLTAKQMTELRLSMAKANTRMKVVKNRLAMRVFDGDNKNEILPHFDEMTAVAFAKGDVAASAKALTQFAKDNEALKVRAGLLEGKVISLADVKALSDLPSRDQLLAQLLAVWAAVPTGFVRVLNAMPNGVVNILDALKKKKESSES